MSNEQKTIVGLPPASDASAARRRASNLKSPSLKGVVRGLTQKKCFSDLAKPRTALRPPPVFKPIKIFSRSGIKKFSASEDQLELTANSLVACLRAIFSPGLTARDVALLLEISIPSALSIPRAELSYTENGPWKGRRYSRSALDGYLDSKARAEGANLISMGDIDPLDRISDGVRGRSQRRT